MLPAVYLCFRVQQYTTCGSLAAKPFTLLIGLKRKACCSQLTPGFSLVLCEQPASLSALRHRWRGLCCASPTALANPGSLWALQTAVLPKRAVMLGPQSVQAMLPSDIQTNLWGTGDVLTTLFCSACFSLLAQKLLDCTRIRDNSKAGKINLFSEILAVIFNENLISFLCLWPESMSFLLSDLEELWNLSTSTCRDANEALP